MTTNKLKKILLALMITLFSTQTHASKVKAEYGERLQKTTKFNYLYDFSSYNSYEQYRLNYQKAVTDLRKNLTFEEINHLTPKDRAHSCAKDNKTAVLLIHGLSDSPFSMNDLQKILNDKCYYTRSLILPGHALQPSALLTTTYQDWINAADFAVNDLRKDFKNVIIVGLSTGGALAINQAYKQKDDFIKSIILMSPAVEITKLNYLWWVTNLMDKISTYFPKLGWMNIAKDEDPYKYESFPYKSSYEIYKLMKINKKLARKNQLKPSLFVALSDVDQTVTSSKTVNWFNKIKSKKKMIVYSNLDHKNTDNIRYIKPENLDEKILDFSHLSIQMNPDNYYYGKHPLYLNCIHYYNDENKYNECKNPNLNLYKGEITKDNLKNYDLRRITYNPQFKDLVAEIISFIGNLR